GDPELPGGTLEFAQWPKNPVALLLVLSGQLMLLGKLAALVNLTVGRGDAWFARWLPFIAASQRPAVIREARVITGALALLAALAWLWLPQLGWLLAAFSAAHLVLGPYLAAEHTGLPTTGDVL